MFNAWGMVSVSGDRVTVIFSAVTPKGRTVNRTIRAKADHPLEFAGAALVAMNTESGAVGVHEIGDTPVIGHPDVDTAVRNVRDWLRAACEK